MNRVQRVRIAERGQLRQAEKISELGRMRSRFCEGMGVSLRQRDGQQVQGLEAGEAWVCQDQRKGQCDWNGKVRRRGGRLKVGKVGGARARQPMAGRKWSTLTQCGEERASLWSCPNGMGYFSRQRSSHQPKLVSKVLKSVLLESLGLEFGFAFILITLHLVRANPCLQPEELFSDKHPVFSSESRR